MPYPLYSTSLLFPHGIGLISILAACGGMQQWKDGAWVSELEAISLLDVYMQLFEQAG